MMSDSICVTQKKNADNVETEKEAKMHMTDKRKAKYKSPYEFNL